MISPVSTCSLKSCWKSVAFKGNHGVVLLFQSVAGTIVLCCGNLSVFDEINFYPFFSLDRKVNKNDLSLHKQDVKEKKNVGKKCNNCYNLNQSE